MQDYKNYTYGLWFKYPNDFVVIPQAGPQTINFGTLLVLKKDDYDQLNEKDSSFSKNPLLSMIDDERTLGIKIQWNRNHGVVSAIDSDEFSLKKRLLGCAENTCEETHLGTPYSVSLSLFDKVDSKNEQSVYQYVVKTKNMSSGDEFNRAGYIWFTNSFLFTVESLKVGDLTNEFSEALKLIATTSAQL